MRSLSSLFLVAFIGHVTLTAASTAPRIVQVQFAGIDPITKRYYVSEISNGPRPLVIGRAQPSRIAVEFSPDSDRAALAAFEKVATHWVFNLSASPKISSDTRLRMTVVINETIETDLKGNQLPRITLRDWKLEFPFYITIENPTYADFFSAKYLADSPKIVLGETLFKEIPSRHFSSDPDKLKSFDIECAKTSPYSLQLKAQLTADAYRSILKESQISSPAAPAKLEKQIEELRARVANLETKNGGCIVSPLIDTGDQWGFTIIPPSLVAAGGPTCDHVIQVFLTRIVTPAEWKQTKSEFNKLKQEQNALTPRILALQKSSIPRSTDDANSIQNFKALGRRMIAIDNPVDGLPSASFKNLGLILTPALGRPVEAPPVSEKSLQAMEAFYRQLASIVDFYNLDEIIALFHPKETAHATN